MDKNKEKRIYFRDWVPLLTTVIIIISSAFSWIINEQSKRTEEEFKKKEERYINLISATRGFYNGSENGNTQLEFMKQLELCWLYCPDEVIHKGYAFLNTVHTDALEKSPKEELHKNANKCIQELILSIRKDLIGRKRIEKTDLKPENFQLLIPTKIKNQYLTNKSSGSSSGSNEPLPAR